MVQETDGNGVTQASSVLGDDELLAQTRGGAVSYYLEDGQGNVRLLTDGNGAITDRYTYDAYGNLLSSQGSTVNPYRYDGQYFDSLTGLYDLRARYYDPTTGRFTSADTADVTLENPTELNRYLYVASDPINAADPSGYDELVEESGVYYIQESAEPSEQEELKQEALLSAKAEAHILALEARFYVELAYLFYRATTPPEQRQKGYPDLGRAGVGLSIYLDPGAVPQRIAAFNDIGGNPDLYRYYRSLYSILEREVEGAGYYIIHRPAFGMTQRQAGRRHEEAWLVQALQIADLVELVREKSFPIIGVSQNTICNTCLTWVFQVPNPPKSAQDVQCILDPVRDITVVAAGVINREKLTPPLPGQICRPQVDLGAP